MKKYKTTKENECRFWEKVEKKGTDDCWEWLGAKNKYGHGVFMVNGKAVVAHRFSHRISTGNPPSRRVVRHTCDNPSCVNPAHLFTCGTTGRRSEQAIEDRFWEKVDKRGPNECWEWQACLNSTGYGNFGFMRETQLAHRVAWYFTNGEWPGEMQVLHKCDNPKCVNPDHLFLGTHQDNMDDKVAKNRQYKEKLTAEKVLALRYGFEQGYFDLTDAARIFGICKPHACDIINRKKWQHI